MALQPEEDRGTTDTMKIRIALFILAFTLLPPASSAAEALKPVERLEKIRNEYPLGEVTPLLEKRVFAPTNNQRKILTYFWHAPAQPYPEGLLFPLVVVLHDSSGFAFAAESLVRDDMMRAFPSFIMVPALSEKSVWADPQQKHDKYEALLDLAELTKTLVFRFKIDPQRIYVIGCAEGGTGVFGSALLLPDLFAAGIAISGEWNERFAPKMAKMPLWAIHGAEDKLVPPDANRNLIAAINKNGGKAYYTEVKGMGKNCPSESLYTPEIWSWMFRQSRP
ncbi:MAG: hypothetical protein HYS17_08910 [Micavibrio aeruginosavorus]|uniref:Phospholipase/carboxylesterase/thioesterase domain-containing protein n=1 Tax=Micavibrio aeruginosavorus TaxID=349221 RepID=A0A7T5UH56_9BACT|nr:MAG: hypothetical protein HYS17_08910 [Micavibrio aeruginosavorus]